MSYTHSDPLNAERDAILAAAPIHVEFDGWSETAFRAAVRDSGIDPDTARAVFPRGAADMAEAFHLRSDHALTERVHMEPDLLAGLRYSEKVAELIWQRLEMIEGDREVVRKSVAFYALPMNAPTGARLLWHTADTIWTALGDTDRDINWYSKRVILSGVYSSSLLFWLGDGSEGCSDTRAFIDRRIGDVMQFEKVKAQLRDTRAWELFKNGPGRLLDVIRAPGQGSQDFPGRWR